MHIQELYRATVTRDMTVKKSQGDFIEVKITSGVVFGIRFNNNKDIDPDKFLAHFKNSEATVIDLTVGE